MKTKTLDFFFFIGSTYTYLSINRIEAIAAQESIEIRWRPFNARLLMIEQNNRPFIDKPVKLQYMWRDLERRAIQYGIPFSSIPPYPVDLDDLAGRVALVASDLGCCSEFTKGIYQSWFNEGLDIGGIRYIWNVLDKLGLNADDIIAAANTEQIKGRYLAETNAARELGVFGSPTFVSSGEVFWGDDRLEDAIGWVKNSA